MLSKQKNAQLSAAQSHSNKITWFTSFALGLICAGTQTAYSATHIKAGQQHVPGELIIKLKETAGKSISSAAVINSLESKFGGDAILGITPFQTDSNLMVYKLKNDKILSQAMTSLKKDQVVEYAEPNFIFRALDDGLPTDPDFLKSWNMNNSGQKDSAGQDGIAGADIHIAPLWLEGFHGSKDVLVAVIDTGIDLTHPDLQANIWTNPGEIDGNGKDDDNNGFIDDVHGWNFATNSNNATDDQNHGSHCAGVIGAQANNNTGTAGVNWDVSLMPVKFLDSTGGGTLQGAVDAINYARKMGAKVMSNSWGGSGFSQALLDAIKATKDSGVVFVAAAGNDSSNNDGSRPTYPSGFPVDNIISVAATDNKDTLASFSNYGAKTVHVAAPGVNIYSTVKGGLWDTYSGTSMATPHVAGIAALLLAANPDWTYSTIKDRLIKTSDPVPGLRRKVVAKGRVNAYNAFYGIVPPSSEPDESAWKSMAQVIESEHPYKDMTNVTFPVKVEGAKYVRVHFDKIDMEDRYDHVTIETPDGVIVDDLTGAMTDYTSEYVAGDSLIIRIRADDSVDKWGFSVDKVQYIGETLLTTR